MSPELQGHWVLEEPHLSFDPVDRQQLHRHPLLGLRGHGPYSERAFSSAHSQVRVALLAPRRDLPLLKGQLNELVREQQPVERREYLPPWPGFANAFRCAIGPADSSAQHSLPDSLDQDLQKAESASAHLASEMVEGLRRLSMVRDRFDVVVFYLPDRYRGYFEDRERGFDLHDAVKAGAARLGLSTQIITPKALEYRCRASVCWRLGTALYAKAGGVPWKLADSDPLPEDSTAYIGLSYALRARTDGKTAFVTCCSQVFDADGAGMDFVAYDVGQGVDPRNPYLSEEDMRLIMSRSLALYQDRHAGRVPTRIVVHKQTPFQKQELAGCVDAWGATRDLECVNITRPPWRGVSLDRPKQGGPKAQPAYAVPRGTVLQLDGRSALTWVAGNARAATLDGHTNYLQGKKGTPRPLLLTRDLGAGPLQDTARDVLRLSKMDWNNDSLYDGVPCTIRFAQILARTIKHMPDLEPVPYDYRLFM